MGLLMSLVGTFIPIVGRFQIFIYTMMSVVFYRVGYKLARPEGYRIGNDAYKDYFPEFGVSAMIIVTCLVLSYVSILIGASLTKNQFDPEPEKSVQGFEAIGSLLFAIIPIYMYGAWFSLKMQ
jgi:ribose/xylose/arabinose/galactoside ABC-type transport system permease subunit